jgi:hypothetical protein
MKDQSEKLLQNPMLEGFSIPGQPDPEVPKPSQEEKPESEPPPAGATIKQELLWPH